jgi:hypothetical protein
MNARRWILAFCLSGLAACGGAEDTMHVSFALRPVQEVGCTLPGLQARLEVAGGGSCALLVNADQTAEGNCPKVATGQVLEFRLVYFASTLLPDNTPYEIQLATATTQADLRDYGDDQLLLTFTQDMLQTDFDDDGDSVSNIQELCDGTNPLPE